MAALLAWAFGKATMGMEVLGIGAAFDPDAFWRRRGFHPYLPILTSPLQL